MNFRPKYLPMVITAMLCSSLPAFANNNEDDPSVELETVTIIIKKRLHAKSEEVTGLGKTIKTMDDLNKNQVLSVKDMVKDVAGVAVVEQGRGASSGYTIRGMDKNRVAVNVDGIAQIQSYLTQKRQFGDGREGSGAINEIELENVSGVQISQGASGSETGSGALGGAVSFRTKSIDDVLDADDNFSAFYKGAYASKNKQKMHSVGAALRHKKADLFVQYTDRTKETVKPHSDIYQTNYEVWRWGGSQVDFDKQAIAPTNDPKRQFIIIDECPTYVDKDPSSVAGCTKPKLDIKPVLETMGAKEYTGDKRVLPDPMEYDSKSVLIKAGFNPSSTQRVELLTEKTTQNYNSRDMTKTAYHLAANHGRGNLAQSPLVYRGQSHQEGYVTDAKIGLWTQAQFFDEKHDKSRYGINYRYQSPKDFRWFDELNLSVDKQNVTIDHLQIEKYCSPYPTVDRNCTPSADKPNSAERQNRKVYSEDHLLWRADFSKNLSGDIINHRLNLGLGLDKFRSNLWIGDVKERYHRLDFKFVDDIKDSNGNFIEAYRINQYQEGTDICQEAQQYLGEARKCGDRPITGHNAYATFKDTISIGDLANITLGVRHDTHRFNSDDDWTGTGKYRNLSYNGSLVLKPTDHVDLLYRISSGYRVPSFKELFGYRLDGLTKGENDDQHYRTNVKPEKARNQEFGIAFHGNLGEVTATYFDNRYSDLIDLTLKGDQWGYRNYQDVRLAGHSVQAKAYLGELWDKLPVGLTASANYLKTKVKDNYIKEGFEYGSGYFLDTISPTRYALSLDYTADSDKWGLGATWIFSDAKKDTELTTLVASPSGTYEKVATTVNSKAWRTLDLSAFYQPTDKLTVRAGIDNVFNYRYSPWESLRQTSVVSGNQHTQGLPSQYAASGRNFVLSVQTKF